MFHFFSMNNLLILHECSMDIPCIPLTCTRIERMFTLLDLRVPSLREGGWGGRASCLRRSSTLRISQIVPHRNMHATRMCNAHRGR